MPVRDVEQVAPSSLRQRLDAGESMTLLDVREDEERAYCSIPAPATANDLHLPMQQVPGRIEELKSLAESGPLIVYCHHGMRSMTVAAWLASRGVTGLGNLEGGVDAYSQHVDSSVKRY